MNPIILIASLGVVTVLLAAWMVILTIKAAKLTKYHDIVLGGLERGDIAQAIAEYVREVRNLKLKTEDLTNFVQRIENEKKDCLQNMGHVRYDAFGDVGGNLSFSLALLNAHGNGFVITAINGRTESRTYAKAITGGSAGSLSDEEQEAIKKAMNLKKTGLE